MEETQGGPDLVERTLREVRPWDMSQPFHRALLGVLLAKLWIVTVVSLDSPYVNLAILFRGIDDEVADLHLMNKAKKLSGVIWYRPRFDARVCGSERGFE